MTVCHWLFVRSQRSIHEERSVYRGELHPRLRVTLCSRGVSEPSPKPRKSPGVAVRTINLRCWLDNKREKREICLYYQKLNQNRKWQLKFSTSNMSPAALSKAEWRAFVAKTPIRSQDEAVRIKRCALGFILHLLWEPIKCPIKDKAITILSPYDEGEAGFLVPNMVHLCWIRINEFGQSLPLIALSLRPICYHFLIAS